MPIEISPLAGDGVRVKFQGVVNGADLIAARDVFFRDARDPQNICFAFVDHSGAESVNYTSGDVEQIAQQDARLARLIQPGAVIAIVSPDDVTFGISRMWEGIAGGLGFESRTFRESSAARDWLRGRVAAKFGIAVPRFE